MTQMMLFDNCSLAPNALAPNALAPNAVVATPPVVNHSASTAAAPAAKPSPGRTPQKLEAEPGVHQLGDLARLVLLRYQLAAQRRQAIQQRRQSVARNAR